MGPVRPCGGVGQGTRANSGTRWCTAGPTSARSCFWLTSLPGCRNEYLQDVPLRRRQPDVAIGLILAGPVSDAQSDPPRCQVNGVRTDMDDRAFFVPTCPPADRSESCEQLIDAERLRDVVVGAGVQGRHLVSAAGAPGQDDDRTAVQPRRPRITSTPSMSGRPRSRTTMSGGWAAASARARRPSAAVPHLVLAHGQIDAQGAEELRFVWRWCSTSTPDGSSAGRGGQRGVGGEPAEGVARTLSGPPLRRDARCQPVGLLAPASAVSCWLREASRPGTWSGRSTAESPG